MIYTLISPYISPKSFLQNALGWIYHPKDNISHPCIPAQSIARGGGPQFRETQHRLAMLSGVLRVELKNPKETTYTLSTSKPKQINQIGLN